MPWWALLGLIALMTFLWFSGRSNRDDVLGLLQRLLAIAVALVVLFFGQNLLLESLVLVLALGLPAVRSKQPAIERNETGRDMFSTF